MGFNDRDKISNNNNFFIRSIKIVPKVVPKVVSKVVPNFVPKVVPKAGPKNVQNKQDFLPKNNILEENHCIL